MQFRSWDELKSEAPFCGGKWDQRKLKEYLIQSCNINFNLNPKILSVVRSFYRILLNPRKRLKTQGFKQVNNSFPFIRSHPLLRAIRELAREKSREDIGF